jgi:hypothetical protein
VRRKDLHEILVALVRLVQIEFLELELNLKVNTPKATLKNTSNFPRPYFHFTFHHDARSHITERDLRDVGGTKFHFLMGDLNYVN